MKHIDKYSIFEASVSDLEKLEVSDEIFELVRKELSDIPTMKELSDIYQVEMENVKDIWYEVQYDCTAVLGFTEYSFSSKNRYSDGRLSYQTGFDSEPKSIIKASIINKNTLVAIKSQ